MDRAAALQQLTSQCQPAIYPTLTDTEVGDLLGATVGYTTWKAGALYAYGARVIPTTPNGHVYKAIQPGTSSTVEPAWPTYTAPDNKVGLTRPYWHGYLGPMPGSQVQDGDVLWLEDGFDAGAYDVPLATYRAWMAKAAKASADYDAELGNSKSYDRSQVFQHCLDMAKRYRPTGPGSFA